MHVRHFILMQDQERARREAELAKDIAPNAASGDSEVKGSREMSCRGTRHLPTAVARFAAALAAVGAPFSLAMFFRLPRQRLSRVLALTRQLARTADVWPGHPDNADARSLFESVEAVAGEARLLHAQSVDWVFDHQLARAIDAWGKGAPREGAVPPEASRGLESGAPLEGNTTSDGDLRPEGRALDGAHVGGGF